jgi:2'-5' RNA ligase
VRLFTAVEVGEAVTAEAARVMAELRRRVTGEHGAKLTWVSPDRMHLTLRFIGEVDEAHAARVAEALTPPLAMPPFQIAWQGLHAFPGPRRPRVLVCDVSRGRDRLLDLEDAVSARLETVGIPREARPYAPHLTLARVREAGRLKTPELFRGLESERLGTTLVEAITLFHSHLSPKGPSYTSLLRTHLEGRAEDERVQ